MIEVKLIRGVGYKGTMRYFGKLISLAGIPRVGEWVTPYMGAAELQVRTVAYADRRTVKVTLEPFESSNVTERGAVLEAMEHHGWQR